MRQLITRKRIELFPEPAHTWVVEKYDDGSYICRNEHRAYIITVHPDGRLTGPGARSARNTVVILLDRFAR